MRDTLDSTLVSAFDLYYDYLSPKEIKVRGLLFLDSGLYEKVTYKNAGHRVNWNEELFIREVDRITSVRQGLSLINYDYYGSLSEQINRAHALFKKYPSVGTDFLVKPSVRGRLIITDDIVKHIDQLSQFDVIGFSERELGSSPLERCVNLSRIRSSINRLGEDKPIHIFGCLDLLNVFPLFCCGADIFDGLCWLRTSYQNYLSIHTQNFAILNRLYSFSEADAEKISYIKNIEYLKRTTRKMMEFAGNHNFTNLEMNSQAVESVKNLLDSAGLDLVS
jgi:hypothetical protein